MTQEEAKLVLDSLSTWIGQERLITEEIVEAIKTLSKSELPSNLDEATKKYRDFREECGIKDPVMLNEIEEAHYAGAEWMAGQGVTVDAKIIMDFSEPTDIINCRLIAKLGDALLKVEPGEVVVQIRNK